MRSILKLTNMRYAVLAIHLKNFTSGESETERLGGGVHLEQSHQLPPQPAWCWEVDWHQPQIRNTGFEIQIHNLHAAEIAWHHKYKHQIYVKYKFTTFLHQVGWPLRGEHYLVPILRTFCKDSVCQGFLLEQQKVHMLFHFSPQAMWFSFKSLHVSNVSSKSIIYVGDSWPTYAVDVDIRCTARNGKFLVRLISVNQMATKML